MVKIIFNLDDCVGCGACVSVCPENWDLDDSGKAKPKETQVDEVGCNSDAADMCPTNAIIIEE